MFLSLFLLSTLSIYWYDFAIIKNKEINWTHIFSFTLKIILPFGVLLVPLIVGLRYYYGKIYELPDEYLILLKGTNKSEVLAIDYRKIIYIKSSNNYVEVIYITIKGQIKKTLIRNTLSQVAYQLPNFLRCHRCFIINPSQITTLLGNQKKAILHLKNIEEDIPVSKSYFKSIKAKVRSPQKEVI